MLLCSPYRILENSMMSSDFSGRLIGMSEQLNKDIFPNSAAIWHLIIQVNQRCLIHLPDEEIEEFETDYQYLKHKIVQTSNIYYNDMMRCLIQALIYRMADSLKHIVHSQDMASSLQSKDFLFRSFLDLLMNTHPTPRSVAWYSNQLHKTPKYLSAAIKQASGKTASDWIHQIVIAEISDMLKNSSKTIKEICNELDFPNLSFFGRYVRTHLGVSPKVYRGERNKGKSVHHT